MKPIDQAIAAIGGVEALKRALGVSRQAIYKWQKGNVPPLRVLEIERVTGVSRHDLRPDIYPREP